MRLAKIGDKYGKLTIVDYVRTDGHYRKFWTCSCDCGGKVVTHTGNLTSGNTRSCGCMVKEAAARKRKPNQASEVTAIILGYKRHAKTRGYCWDISRELFQSVISRPCHYCGLPPSNSKRTKNSIIPLLYSGVDRKDNSVGYIENNIVPCCAKCNLAKLDMSVEDFFAWVMRVSAMANQWSIP